jgi:ubiquinone/menaquinone biosynthesis C-methylase UbiE
MAGVPYTLPKDDEEINRLDFQHYMLRFALRGNYAAPIGSPRSVLDVGTGSGRWPVEMASIFPKADVVGLDVVPAPADGERKEETRPANYRFVAGNVLEGLSFADGSFDFVHQRLLIGALPADRWPGVVRELIRVTRRGGWVELVEANIWPENGGPALNTLGRWVYDAVARRGIDVQLCSHIGEMLTQGGMAGVTQREIRLPLGRKFGRLGTMMETNHLALFESLKGLIVATGIAASDEAFEQTLATARSEIAERDARIVFYLADGQRGS